MRMRFETVFGKNADIIEEILSSPEIPDDLELSFKIRLCVEEIVENICSYAYGADSDGWLEVEAFREGSVVSISFKDAGIPFNPLEKPDPDITLPAEDRQIGGLGIFLCKQLMDEVTYTHLDGCNILTMLKRC